MMYFSWSNGDSIAIFVPIDTARKPGVELIPQKESKCPQKVYVSPYEGAIYHNEEKLCDLPKPDNRCYILGRDLKLNDSGRSAEWMLGPGYEDIDNARSLVIKRVEDEAGGVSWQKIIPDDDHLKGKLNLKQANV